MYIGLTTLGLEYETFLSLTPNILFKMFIMHLRKENPNILKEEEECVEKFSQIEKNI